MRVDDDVGDCGPGCLVARGINPVPVESSVKFAVNVVL